MKDVFCVTSHIIVHSTCNHGQSEVHGAEHEAARVVHRVQYVLCHVTLAILGVAVGSGGWEGEEAAP